MRVIFHTAQKIHVATKDEKLAYKDIIYAAFSEASDLPIDNAYYRVKGLLVRLPVDDPPEVQVTVERVRLQQSGGDNYC